MSDPGRDPHPLTRFLRSPLVPWLAAGWTLALGLVFIFVWAPHPWGWQGIDFYHDLAKAVARGEPFSTTDVPWGYAWFVALVYRVAGEQPWAPLVAQAAANALVPVLLYHLVRPLAGPVTAGLSALLIGVFSFNTVYASTQASDSICTVLFLAALLALAHGVRTKRASWWLAAGLLAGLSAQFRPNLVLFPLVAGLLYVAWPPRTGRKAGLATVFVLGSALALAPWTVRNYRLTGDVLPTSSHGAIQLWYGTLQTGPYLENFSRNPRTVFASPTFPYTSRAHRTIVVSVHQLACDWNPDTVRLVFWTDRDPTPTSLLPAIDDDRFVFTVPGQPLGTAVYLRFDAEWSLPGAGPRPPAYEGGRYGAVYFVSDNHLDDLDRHGDLLDIFDIVRLVRHLAWQDSASGLQRLDLDGSGQIDRGDLAEAVRLLLEYGQAGGATPAFDGLEVSPQAATVRLAGGSHLTVPRSFSGHVTDLDVRGEEAGGLVTRARSFANIMAARRNERPVPCRVMDDVRINQVFYRSELDRMRRYTALALDNIGREPGAFLAASAYRTVRMFVVRFAGDVATIQQFPAARLAYAVGFLLSSVYLLAFLAGAVVAWRQRSALLWFLVPILYVPMTLAVVLTNMRYTVTVQPLMFAFVALAVVTLLRLDPEGRGQGSEMSS